MGKRRHARAKSKLKFGKKKLRENGVHGKNEESRSEEEEDYERRKQTRDESIWRKWFTFVREHWLLRKTKNFQEETTAVSDETVTDEYNVGGMSLEANSTETDTEPVSKLSDIPVKPTYDEVQASVSQQEGKREKIHIKPMEQTKLEENFSLESRIRFSACPLSSSSHGPHVSFSETEEDGKSERETDHHRNFHTSALYIRENMNLICESTNSEDTGFSIQVAGSRNSTDGSRQGCEPTDCKNESENEEKALKSISEPCWDEKRKIFRHQKLQENINELIEQFMILEKDDLLESYHLNLTKIFEFRNKLKQEKAKLRLESCGLTFPFGNSGNEMLLTEASREVSPEILVNIKPFKEYMSNRYIQVQDLDEMDAKIVSKIRGKDSKSSVAKKARSEKKRIRFEDENDGIPSEEGEVKDSNKNLPEDKNKITKCQKISSSRKIENHWPHSCNTMEPNEKSLPSKSVFEISDSVVCSVWGIYKAYEGLNSLVAQSPSITEKESLEKVLDDFDDKDHDVIFRQNMDQFRKLISCQEEPACSGADLTSIPSVVEESLEEKDDSDVLPFVPEEKQTPHVEENLREERVAEVEVLKMESLHDEPKIFENLSLISVDCTYLKGRIYRNCYFIPFESNTCQMRVAARIETFSISNLMSSSEWLNLDEMYLKILVEKVNPEPLVSPFEIVLVDKTEMAKFREEDSQTNCSTANVSDKSEYETASSSLALLSDSSKPEKEDSGSLDRNKAFVRPTDCFYLTDLKHTSGENSERRLENGVNIERLTALFFPPETVHRALEIVDGSAREFVLEYLDSESVPAFHLLGTTRGLSVTDFGRKNSSKSKISSSSSDTFPGNSRKETVGEHGKIPEGSFKLVFKRKNNFSEHHEENEGRISGMDGAKLDEKVILEKLMSREEAETKKDGFKILYDGLFDKCLNDCDDERRVGPDLERSIALGYRTASELFEETGMSKLPEPREPGKLRILSQIQLLKAADKTTAAKLFKYRSVSTGREHLTQGERHTSEYRLRRFLQVINDPDKSESQQVKKKRTLPEKGIEIRRTGSAFMRKSGAFLGSIYIKETAGADRIGLRFANGWQTLTRTKNEVIWRQETSNEAPGTPFDETDEKDNNRSKELMAAINSIRESDRSREDIGKGTKRMSLVILLSKNKEK